MVGAAPESSADEACFIILGLIADLAENGGGLNFEQSRQLAPYLVPSYGAFEAEDLLLRLVPALARGVDTGTQAALVARNMQYSYARFRFLSACLDFGLVVNEAEAMWFADLGGHGLRGRIDALCQARAWQFRSAMVAKSPDKGEAVHLVFVSDPEAELSAAALLQIARRAFGKLPTRRRP